MPISNRLEVRKNGDLDVMRLKLYVGGREVLIVSTRAESFVAELNALLKKYDAKTENSRDGMSDWTPLVLEMGVSYAG